MKQKDDKVTDSENTATLKEMSRTHPTSRLDTLIFLIILNSIWKFVVVIDNPREKSHKRRQKGINFVFNKKSLNERDINICIGDNVFS